MPTVPLTEMMDSTTDLIFACFTGGLAFLSLVGLIYIIVDDAIRFKQRQEYLKEREKQEQAMQNR